MKPARIFSLAFLILIFAFSTLGYAGVPQMINYQGKLTTPQGALIDDTLSMVFTIYDAASDGGVFWIETQATVIVEKGIFTVLLGSVNPIPDTVFTGAVRYLGVKVEADPEMTPRKEIVSVGYAYKAEYSDTAEYSFYGAPDDDWDLDTAGINVYRLTGNVGIGTPTPQEKLDVAGTAQVTGFKMPTSASDGYVLTSDASGVGTWQATGGIGGSGTANYVTKFTASTTLGNSAIYETSGYVGIGTASPEFTLSLINDGGIIAKGTFGAGVTLTTSGAGTRFIWYPRKAAVRGGFVSTNEWDDANIGYYSAAFGRSNKASGSYSNVSGGSYNLATNSYTTVSGGGHNTASGNDATVGGGMVNTASGYAATIPGGYADTAAGDYSFASGYKVNITSDGDYTFAFGRNFTTSTPNAVIFHNSVDPIKVGIGTTSPTGTFDVNGDDIRIRSSQTPASASADGYTGEIAWDSDYIYICVSGDGPGGSTDSWKRAALSTW